MRDFVRHDVAANRRRSEDQPPAEADPAAADEQLPQRVPASPTLTADAVTSTAAAYSATSRDIVSTARRLRKASIRRGNAGFRPAEPQYHALEARACAALPGPTGSGLPSPSRGISAPASNGSAGQRPLELRLDPVALIESPGERRPPARAPRTREFQRAGCLVEPQAQAPCATSAGGFRSEPEAPLQGRLQSGRSTT